jgi:serine/threonine protein kinase
VKIKGVTIDDKGCYCVVMDFCSRGTLISLLNVAYKAHQTRGAPFETLLPPQAMFRIVYGTVCGLEALARSKVVHNDIAARNILLDESGSPKVSDFGLSKKMGNEYYGQAVGGGPVRWSAPEWWSGRASEKSDVWSFGTLLIEITTGQVPYATFAGTVMELLQRIYQGSISPLDDLSSISKQTNLEIPKWVGTLLASCLQADPAARPTFSQLRQHLESTEPDLLRSCTETSIFDNEAEFEQGAPTVSSSNTSSSSNNISQLDPSDIFLDSRLGGGQFGEVMLGTYRGRYVAVKVQEETPQVVAEIAVMSAIPRHPNIIKFLGTYVKDGKVHLVMELAPQGSLETVVIGRDLSKPFPEAVLFRWSLGIAQGMEFLVNHKIIHRDLAARNILLTKQLDPKVSDFGFARSVGQTEAGKTDSVTGPIRIMAPENFSQVYSEKSDVWSYGCLLLEILSGKRPFNTWPTLESIILAVSSQQTDPLKDALANGELRGVQSYYLQLMKSCFQFRPEDRPTFSSIVAFLIDAVDWTIVEAERLRRVRLQMEVARKEETKKMKSLISQFVFDN